MIKDYLQLSNLDTQHNELHRKLFNSSFGIISTVGTDIPNVATLPVGYGQFCNISGVMKLYVNINGKLFSVDASIV